MGETTMAAFDFMSPRFPPQARASQFPQSHSRRQTRPLPLQVTSQRAAFCPPAHQDAGMPKGWSRQQKGESGLPACHEGKITTQPGPSPWTAFPAERTLSSSTSPVAQNDGVCRRCSLFSSPLPQPFLHTYG
uniref:Uncharacterized protein n=1 Tax=Micrurus corallinus TaxID=54390 RepID=A0A2D4F119_MICCO